LINEIDIISEVQQNFIDSSYDTNTNRAFPDIRDGLKPGQRACLWEMYTKKYTSKKPHVKSAKISGGVAALWWPHGTTAIYETFARMSQPFTNNIPEVDFHGSNGNVILGGDAIAADRYTEARLAPIVEQGMLGNIQKSVVPMQSNFSEDDEWPTVLPAIFPRLLVNGAQGIGVSLSNVWLPHSFSESAGLLLHYIETGELDEDNFYPDFPTGGTIINKDELATINKTGRGKVIVESKFRINGNEIDFYELPYQVFIEPVIDEIKKAIDEEKITGIADVYNKSDKKRISLVVTCTPGVEPLKVVAQLFTATNLRKQFNANQNGIISKTPIMITLKKYVDTYIEHNTGCIKREYEYDLDAAQKRIHILEGLSIALEDIDNVIELIKSSKNKSIAATNLCEKYQLSFEQADAILKMTLSRLTNMDQIAIANELQEKKQLALTCQEVIESYKKQTEILAERLRDLVKKFGDKRRTDVIQKDIPKTSTAKKAKELIIEDVIVTRTMQGYLKSIPVKVYREARINIEKVKARTDDIILLFSSLGKMYRLKVGEIKQCAVADKGTALGAILSLEPNEKILYMTNMNIDQKHPYITGVTEKGLVKKSDKTIFIGSTQNKRGMKCAGLNEGDSFIWFGETNGDYMTLVTSDQMGIQFKLDEINPVGKTAKGVKGIALNEGATIVRVSMGAMSKALPVQHRAGKGNRLS
jgi:DNA gyrase subunit A